MDLSSTPFTHHGADQAVLMLPYLALIGMAIFLQYFQMKQMNSRNPQAAAANPQMQTMQKFFPIIFGVIYLRVPAGATIYMVVSSAMRIGTQEFMFRSGMVTPVAQAKEREIGAATKPKPKPGTKPAQLSNGNGKAAPTDGTAAKGPAAGNGKATTNGKSPTAGKRPPKPKITASADDEAEQDAVPKEHPRARAKRTRKAR